MLWRNECKESSFEINSGRHDYLDGRRPERFSATFALVGLPLITSRLGDGERMMMMRLLRMLEGLPPPRSHYHR